MVKNNIGWIDLVKAICMISVYLLHVESYVGMVWIKSYGYLLQPFYVNAFFFVSGYLFFRKWIGDDRVDEFSWGKYADTVKNLFFRIVVPTIVFASIFYIPKGIFNSGKMDFGSYFYDVWGGVSFWFTSALIVAQLVLLVLLFTKQKSVWFYLVISVGIFCFAYYLARVDITPFPWYYKSGLAATLFMTLGGVYQKYESMIDGRIGRVGWWIVALVYFNLMIWDFNQHSFSFALMSVKFNMMGMVVVLLGIGFIVGLCKVIKGVRWLEYIGKNSILFYFCSGIVPASLSTLFVKFVELNYCWVVVIACLSLLVAYIISLIVNRYLLFLLDFRRIKNYANSRRNKK